MSEAVAREIVMVWKDHHYPGRPKTQQVELAEQVIKNAPPPKPADLDSLKKLSRQQSEMIREIEKSDQLSQSEKTYLVKLHKEIKSFYDRYYRRAKIKA